MACNARVSGGCSGEQAPFHHARFCIDTGIDGPCSSKRLWPKEQAVEGRVGKGGTKKGSNSAEVILAVTQQVSGRDGNSAWLSCVAVSMGQPACHLCSQPLLRSLPPLHVPAILILDTLAYPLPCVALCLFPSPPAFPRCKGQCSLATPAFWLTKIHFSQ